MLQVVATGRSQRYISGCMIKRVINRSMDRCSEWAPRGRTAPPSRGPFVGPMPEPRAAARLAMDPGSACALKAAAAVAGRRAPQIAEWREAVSQKRNPKNGSEGVSHEAALRLWYGCLWARATWRNSSGVPQRLAFGPGALSRHRAPSGGTGPFASGKGTVRSRRQHEYEGRPRARFCRGLPPAFAGTRKPISARKCVCVCVCRHVLCLVGGRNICFSVDLFSQ